MEIDVARLNSAISPSSFLGFFFSQHTIQTYLTIGNTETESGWTLDRSGLQTWNFFCWLSFHCFCFVLSLVLLFLMFCIQDADPYRVKKAQNFWRVLKVVNSSEAIKPRNSCIVQRWSTSGGIRSWKVNHFSSFFKINTNDNYFLISLTRGDHKLSRPDLQGTTVTCDTIVRTRLRNGMQ